MFGLKRKNKELTVAVEEHKKLNQLVCAKLAAIGRSSASIEFTPDGIITTANRQFLNTFGYTRDEIKGKHHRIFCDPDYANSSAYSTLWNTLNRGEFLADQFERVSKSGEHVWLEASYNPIINSQNELISIVKYATDISEKVKSAQEQRSIIQAAGRSMAVIEFTPEGVILNANENFLRVTGYNIDELRGRHHRILCDDTLVNSQKYTDLWQSLLSGQFVSGQFERKGKFNQKIWLEASYNPILDPRGNLTKIVKFATDVTQRIEAANTAQNIALSTSLNADQAAQQGAGIVEQTTEIMTELSDRIAEASAKLDELNTHSDQINNIVATISAIADQTNSLALNAAIEAARAGEQGRGFAVVADEVRSLAARTSSSTIEIADVVTQNLSLSQAASKTMQDSIEQVVKGANLVQNISANIETINAGIGKIVSTMKTLK